MTRITPPILASLNELIYMSCNHCSEIIWNQSGPGILFIVANTTRWGVLCEDCYDNGLFFICRHCRKRSEGSGYRSTSRGDFKLCSDCFNKPCDHSTQQQLSPFEFFLYYYLPGRHTIERTIHHRPPLPLPLGIDQV